MATATMTEMETHLLKLGQQADRGEIDPDDISIANEPESPSETVEAPEPEESPEEQPPTEEEKPSDKSAETKPVARTKAEKEQERLEKTWENANKLKEEARAEREAVEAERAKVKAEREEIERSRPKPEPEKPQLLKDDRGFTAEDYEAFAQKKWEERNDDPDAQSIAEAAMRTAHELRNTQAKQEREKFEGSWWDGLIKLSDEIPEIAAPIGGKTAGPLYQDMCQLLAPGTPTREWFLQHRNGYRIAADLVRFRHQAGSVPALKADIQRLTKENQRLAGLTTTLPTGATRSGRGESGAAKDLTATELLRLAAEIDNAA